MVWTFLLFEGIEQENELESSREEIEEELNGWQCLLMVINRRQYFAVEEAKTWVSW